MSNETALISRGGLQSNDAYISWTTEGSWYSHESYGMKPDWFSQSKFFSCRYLNIELNKSFSRIFPRIGNKETGL